MPRLLITYDYPVQKLERISIYIDDASTQKTSMERVHQGQIQVLESLVADIPIGNLVISYLCLPPMPKRSGPILSRSQATTTSSSQVTWCQLQLL